ncbi:MAG: alanine racemase [Syntrophomonas sp.]|uniref:alanine racemase n=1 Tax=Syntrophomonas sp. TaxID=2053627 RepID=UPI00262EC1F5|nr:alanine racemase [Syntrophomonas sp.]MDD2509801.1 alanine racemase [Syntrophomonas sp.]MDD3879476.1 alanine racemase [Syntrophomonas sp.]MDD4625639.1 alanine racemase [Syntrophomonas sp.]
MDNRRPTWAEIDLTAIKHNMLIIKNRVSPAMIMAVVKADGYGHGMLEVSRACLQEGVEWLGVASLDEAIHLRESGITAPVLVLGFISEEFAEAAVEHEISATVFSFSFARALSQAAGRLSRTARVHIKVDTGMGRLGFAPIPQSIALVQEIAAMPGIEVQGIFTHFADADTIDKSFTYEQLRIFSKFVKSLEEGGLSIPLKHCSNSAALLDIPEARLNMVRAGIVIYGLYPSEDMKQLGLDIIPAMTLKSRVSYLKVLEPGHYVSYGRTFCCQRATRVATVPIGYADGYHRLLSNRSSAVIRGEKVPSIGMVCMDQCMFDVSGLERVEEGDEVILFGKPSDGVTADDLARILGTINYEIVCALSARVPRLYSKAGGM